MVCPHPRTNHSLFLLSLKASLPHHCDHHYVYAFSFSSCAFSFSFYSFYVFSCLSLHHWILQLHFQLLHFHLQRNLSPPKFINMHRSVKHINQYIHTLMELNNSSNISSEFLTDLEFFNVSFNVAMTVFDL